MALVEKANQVSIKAEHAVNLSFENDVLRSLVTQTLVEGNRSGADHVEGEVCYHPLVAVLPCDSKEVVLFTRETELLCKLSSPCNESIHLLISEPIVLRSLPI